MFDHVKLTKNSWLVGLEDKLTSTILENGQSIKLSSKLMPLDPEIRDALRFHQNYLPE